MSEEFAKALASSDTVAVVGVGNVALDCARILAKGKKDLTMRILKIFCRLVKFFRAVHPLRDCACAEETTLAWFEVNPCVESFQGQTMHAIALGSNTVCGYTNLLASPMSSFPLARAFRCNPFVISTGANALKDSDICGHALDVLSSAGAGLRRVVILGRRGHVQASFTMKVCLQV